MGVSVLRLSQLDYNRETALVHAGGGHVATIYDVLDTIRGSAQNTHEKGFKFELASLYFLKNDPVWRQKFSNVWMWEDSPIRTRPDMGIDLVAKDADTDQYWAIQCKCYDDGYSIQKHNIDSFFNEAGKEHYIGRIVISSTENWSGNALNSLDDWKATRIGPRDMNESPIDWGAFLSERDASTVRRPTHDPFPHQERAIEDVLAGFHAAERGKLIMACGTGKTLTSLRLAEKMAPNGHILFLVPSISLLSQTLREWANQARVDLRSFAVCSDTKVGVRKGEDTSEISIHDMPYPVTTNPTDLHRRLTLPRQREAMTVVFSTYQSIQTIADAQKAGAPAFDLIICDEAHRTTGAKGVSDADESYFTKVHDNKIVRGENRLYMTATPRIYGDKAKRKAQELSFEIASMDDAEKFGEEFHRLGFGEAVALNLLTDYRVIVLTVDEAQASKAIQESLKTEEGEFPVPEAAKIIGCWNGLVTRGQDVKEGELAPSPLRRAVAFCSNIKDSEQLRDKFSNVIDAYQMVTGDETLLRCDVDHVDGTMNALKRTQKLDWLNEDPGESVCRILSNARCLSEGVDVPALDAVIFMKPRRSKVDIIQAVGRVMRKAKDKKYGYIILPICIPAGVPPAEALNDNKNFEVVWEILQALRSHDERFDAMINSIKFDGTSPVKIKPVGTGDGDEDDDSTRGDDLKQKIVQMALAFPVEEWQKAINAKIVDKVGTRVYWEDWAKDVSKIAEQHIDRITRLLDSNVPAVDDAFDKFLNGLRESENDNISRPDAIEMLAQHLITAPVFDALFKDYSFVEHNPVSQVMEEMISILHQHRLDSEDETLEKFYSSVRRRIEGIDTDAGRQAIIKELYENFFNLAFRKTAEAMGIVYTPIEVVDFILHSVDDALRREFGQTIGDPGVHVLDPFTGTGTFIVRLLQSGLITPEQLQHKYLRELHANEIVLLAYYIASINIEHTFHGLTDGGYQPFPGAVLTDTFQMSEADDVIDVEMFVDNSERVLRQLDVPIRVIVGNPPYSAGQRNANDNNQNMKYEALDQRIKSSYVARTNATLRNALYDSYIRAFRWATDRVGDMGVVCFVSNGGWLDGAAMDGFRKCLADDFTSIYVLNLRGNQRTSGETSRKEGGKIFGSGSRTSVTLTMLIKNPAAPNDRAVHYYDIGEYLTREQKLEALTNFKSMKSLNWEIIKPDDNGDWLNQRERGFDNFLPLAQGKYRDASGIFVTYSNGLKTNRDAWVYSFSREALRSNVGSLVSFYNEERTRYRESGSNEPPKDFVKGDAARIKWTRALYNDVARDVPIDLNKSAFQPSMHRPFCRQWVYFDPRLNEVVGQMPLIFPNEQSENRVICVTGVGSSKEFSALMTNLIPNYDMQEKSACFPLYWYQEQRGLGGLFDGDAPGFHRRDGILDSSLRAFREAYDDVELTKEDVFYYIYGVLHSPEYRTRFESNLKKEVPRIPFASDFATFSQAGRALARLHLDYENVEPWSLEELHQGSISGPSYRVEKLRYAKDGKQEDRSRIVVNASLSLAGIPEEAHRYVVNGQSALWWIMDRYQIKTDKDSGIVNDPNTWSDDPRYVVDLIKRIVRVSVETVQIVDALPPLDELGAEAPTEEAS